MEQSIYLHINHALEQSSLQYLTDCPTSESPLTKCATLAQALFPTNLNEYNPPENGIGDSPHEYRASIAPKDNNANRLASAALALQSDLVFNSRCKDFSNTAITIEEMLSEMSVDFSPAPSEFDSPASMTFPWYSSVSPFAIDSLSLSLTW